MKAHLLLGLALLSLNAAAPAGELAPLYQQAEAAWAQGRHLEALQGLDYLAYQGHKPAQARLCHLESQGQALVYNPTKATFWCQQAASPARERRAE